MFFQALVSPREGVRMFISGKTFFLHLIEYMLLKVGLKKTNDSQVAIAGDS